ncbi:MAG: hypothetical protein ACM3H8_12895 [Sphingobacteriales bacterium]
MTQVFYPMMDDLMLAESLAIQSEIIQKTQVLLLEHLRLLTGAGFINDVKFNWF